MKANFFILALLGMMIASFAIVVSCSEEQIEEATLTLSGAPLEPVAAVGGKVDLTVESNADWTATSSDLEVATVTPATGKNNGHVTVEVLANAGTATRTVTVTVAVTGKTQTVTINQVAADVVVDPTLTLTAAIPAEVSAAGAAYTVNVTSNLDWTVTSSNTLTADAAPTTGTNNGTFTVTVNENAATITRAATITVTAGTLTKTLAIAQAASTVTTPTLSVTPATITQSADAGTFSIAVNSNSAWTVTTAPAWASATPTSGNGTQGVTIGLTKNEGAARTATITVKVNETLSKTVTVTQEEVFVPTLGVTAFPPEFDAEGGDFILTVESNSTWSYRISEADQQVVTKTDGVDLGNGNGTIQITVSANSGTTTRSATVTLYTGDLEVPVGISQKAAIEPLISASTTTIAGGVPVEAASYTIPVTSNVTWTATSNQGWATVTNGTNISGNGTFTIGVSQNTGAERSATITLTGGGAAPKTVVITQEEVFVPTLGVDPANLALTFGPEGFVNKVIGVTSNSTWSYRISEPDKQVVTKTGGNETSNGDGGIAISVSANTTTAQRSATFTLYTGDLEVLISITQEGAAATLQPVGSAGLTAIRATGATLKITVNSNVAWTAVSTDQTVFGVTPAGGTGNGAVTLTVSPNTATTTRNATLTFTGGGLEKTLLVTQLAFLPELASSIPPVISGLPAGGLSGMQLGITSNIAWTATSNQTWATLDNATQTGDGEAVLAIAANTATEERTVVITVAGNAYPETTLTFTITQAGVPPPPTMQTFAPTGSEAVGTTWSLVDSRDQQAYNVVKMADNKIWMAQNLNFTTGLNLIDPEKYTPSSPNKVSQGAGSDKWLPGQYACRDNHCDRWGAHYTEAAKASVCPSGWHVPSHDGDFDPMFAAVRSALGITADTDENKRKLIFALNKPNDPQAGFDYWAWDDGSYTNSTGFSAIGSGMLEPDWGTDNGSIMLSAAWSTLTYRWTTSASSQMLITDTYPQLIPLRCVKNNN